MRVVPAITDDQVMLVLILRRYSDCPPVLRAQHDGILQGDKVAQWIRR